MADAHRNRPCTGSRRQPSRLQSRAPSSLQVSRSVDWKVAIPLLSPLASSPPPPAELKQAALREEQKPQQQQQQQRHQSAEHPEKVVFKKWQHPAAPFCYEPGSLAPPFVPV